ncbi:ABC transporter ATP-binding protein [Arcanobacterium haemolyticum]|nr:ABC transporter ATP-binding protein [Arcanobacterium haemolyticum]
MTQPPATSHANSTASQGTPNQPNLRELVRWLTGMTKPVHKPLLVSTCFRLLNLTLDVLLFGLAAGGVSAIIVEGAPALPIFAWLVVIALVKASAYYLEQLTGHYVAFKALELLRTAVFSKLWPKAPAIVTHSHSGDVLASLTRDVDRIEVVYAHTFAPVVSAYVVPPAILIVTGATVGWDVVALPALCMAIALFVVPFVGFRRAVETTRATLGIRRDLAHHLTDSVFGTEEVVGYGRQSDRLEETDELSRRVAHEARTPKAFAAFRRCANLFLMLATVISASAASIAHGHTIVVTAALAAGALRLFEGPRGVEDATGYLDHSLAAARRLWDMSHAPEAVEDGPDVFAPTSAPAVTFNNISYAYRDENGELAGFALDKVDVHVPAGSRTVFVGPSGSGKSTTVQMLLRYDDPQSGDVLLDGEPVTQYTLDSLRRNVVAVSQKNQLLNATIWENVTLGVPEASEADVWRVLRDVHLDEEIAAMPEGLRTHTGQAGSALSGGQAQRLCLARALLMKPAVLVLDEFTANLNVDLEREIREDIAAALPGATVIEVTHRVESATDADQIVMLDRGKVVACGSPQELADGLAGLFHRDV